MTTMVRFGAVVLLAVIFCIPFAESKGRVLVEHSPALGVTYGQVADNLPPPSAVAHLVQSTLISKVKLYGADPAILKAFANTGIGMVVGVANDQIPSFNQLSVAQDWVKNNIVPFVPATNIIAVCVGNEVLYSGDQNLMAQLLPALQNLHTALVEVSLDRRIKVSTPHSMALLSNSEPPSMGRIKDEYMGIIKPLLEFLRQTGAPLMINPYPYFAYKSDPTDSTLAYALFQANAGRVDTNTGLHYTNMLDAQLDAVYSALKSLGYTDVDIVVAETGWPSQGDPDEAGVNMQNAMAYNGNLIKHVISMVGTPLRPNKSIETYIFALFNEDKKSGPTSERNFGLFKADMSMAYDVGLRQSPSASPTPTTPSSSPATPAPSTGTPATAPPTSTGKAWCVPKAGVDDKTLQQNLDYACGQGIDCRPIQPGGACYTPNTVVAHATYAMNALYQTLGRNSWNCDFSHTATLTSVDPSYGGCAYPHP
uniref:glucan endo-1,3-beta-D-glucosidase n=1 Tax=Araucaria cunninghamii TaxID=56994 RepID=A0A0D6QVV0_ARACU